MAEGGGDAGDLGEVGGFLFEDDGRDDEEDTGGGGFC